MQWTNIIGPAVTAPVVSAVVTILTSWLSGRRQAHAEEKKSLEDHLLRFSTEVVSAAHSMAQFTYEAYANLLEPGEIEKYRQAIGAHRAVIRAEQLIISLMRPALSAPTDNVAVKIETYADDIDSSLEKKNKTQPGNLGIAVDVGDLIVNLRNALSIYYTAIK